MCRMLAFSSISDIAIRGYLNKLKKMAKDGKKAPHKDGFGYFALNSCGIFSLVKSKNSIIDKNITTDFKAKILIAHARKASPETKKGDDQAHPFSFYKNGNLTVLAHNGSLKEYSSDVLGVDTEQVLRIIAEEGFEEGTKTLSKMNYRALNLLVFQNDFLYALRLTSAGFDYYTLFVAEKDGLVVVSSESVFKGMQPLENGQALKIKDGEVMKKWQIKDG
ncbi:MAG: class II glutamine amidotransferase [Thermotogaceae bacterium]|nr:class II glutamine amidotransferase [Thermotogaceae bacterium]